MESVPILLVVAASVCVVAIRQGVIRSNIESKVHGMQLQVRPFDNALATCFVLFYLSASFLAVNAGLRGGELFASETAYWIVGAVALVVGFITTGLAVFLPINWAKAVKKYS